MTRRERWVLLALLLVAAGLRVWAILVSSPVDDAYITFRYARNLAAGHGFVYNLGERVLGTTTPMFALLLTPFAWLRIPPDRAAAGLAVLASLGVMVLLFIFVRRVVSREESAGREVASLAGLIAAAVYALFYAQIVSCGFGMESQVFEFFVLASLVTAISDRPRRSGLFAGIAALVRPEGFLLALLLGLAAVVRKARGRGAFPWSGVAVFAAVVLPWMAFATLYFGSFVPNSALAKASQRRISVQDWAHFFVLRNPVIALAWALAALGAISAALRRSAGLGLLAAWAAAYLCFYLVARPPFLGIWYFPPLASPLMALATIGVLWPHFRIRRLQPRLLLGAFAIGWVGLLLVSAPRALQTAAWSRTIVERVYLPMAAWARDHSGPDDLVEVPDIGYVGYFSGRTILDAGGLVSPELWRDYAAHAGDPAKDVRFTLRRKPAILLLPILKEIYQRHVDGGLLNFYEPVVRFQAEGITALPAPGEALPPDRTDGRFVPDYIAFRRIEGR